jgi:hypothetical protein
MFLAWRALEAHVETLNADVEHERLALAKDRARPRRFVD